MRVRRRPEANRPTTAINEASVVTQGLLPILSAMLIPVLSSGFAFRKWLDEVEKVGGRMLCHSVCEDRDVIEIIVLYGWRN